MTDREAFDDSLRHGYSGTAEASPTTTRAQLEALGSSSEWQQLTPNAPSATDLMPAEVSGADLATVYDAVVAMPGFSESLTGSAVDGKAEVVRQPANQFIDLGEAGQLSFVDSGQTKAVWRWARGGKSMALGIEFDGNYISREGHVRIPDDPNLVPAGAKTHERYSEYSDLRTYARIPIGDHFIKLQEFGEVSSMPEPLRRSKVEEASTRARRNILRAAPAADLSFTDDELKHQRHFLHKEGYEDLFVIDIPVKEVLSRGSGHSIGENTEVASDERWANFVADDVKERGVMSRHEAVVGALGRVFTGRSSSHTSHRARSSGYAPRHANRSDR